MTDGSDFYDKCLKYLNFHRFKARYLMLCKQYKDYDNPECTVVWYPLDNDEVVEAYKINLKEQPTNWWYLNIHVEIGAWDGWADEVCERKYKEFIEMFCGVLCDRETSETIKVVRSQFVSVNECLLDSEDIEIDDCR